MPMYRDSEGNRYWFDEVPDPELVRSDLVLMTDEEAAAAEAAQAALVAGE